MEVQVCVSHFHFIKNPLSIHSLRYGILYPHMRSVFFSTGSTQSLPCHTASGDNCTSSICPNTVVTYTCNITSGTPAGLTDWTLPTGTCPTNAFPDKIRLSQFVSGQCSAQGASGVPSMCGPYRATSILPSNATYCLSSNLTINITAAMNGSTVMCNNTDIGTSASIIVSMTTIKIVGMPFIFTHVICANSLTLHCQYMHGSSCTVHVCVLYSCTLFTMLHCWLNYQQPCCWYLSMDY